MKENAFITLYNESPIHVRIGNGFSFVRHLLNGDDIFVPLSKGFQDLLKIKKRLKEYKKIYCSLSFDSELDYLNHIIDKRWTIGGPLCHHANLSHIKCTKFSGCFEELLNVPISSVFNKYWKDEINPPKEIQYTCNIGQGCYWNKCKFCEYKYYEKNNYKRDNIDFIFHQLKDAKSPEIIHLCNSAISPKTLDEVISSYEKYNFLKNKTHIVLFVRPDAGIIRIIEKYDKLEGITFCIGVEAFCQKALDLINKGTKIENILSLCDQLSKKEAVVVLSLMDNYVFMNSEMADESIKNIIEISRMPKYTKRKNKGVFAFNNGTTYWPEENFIKKFSSNNKVVMQGNKPHWVSIIDKNSEAFKSNQRISYAIEQNLRTMGAFFETLDSSWSKIQRENQVKKIIENKI